MIPVHITVHSVAGQGRIGGVERKVNIEILDLPALTPQAVMVTLYEALLATNESTAETSYHVSGTIDLSGNGRKDAGPHRLICGSRPGTRYPRLYRPHSWSASASRGFTQRHAAGRCTRNRF